VDIEYSLDVRDELGQTKLSRISQSICSVKRLFGPSNCGSTSDKTLNNLKNIKAYFQLNTKTGNIKHTSIKLSTENLTS
jgi:hypothetical protein